MIRHQCRECKWHSILTGGNYSTTYCNFSGYHDRPARRRSENGTMIDLRGNDPDFCELFESGIPESRQLNATKIYRGRRRKNEKV